MAEYLEGFTWGEGQSTIESIEKTHPGFKERVKAFDEDIQGYRSTSDEFLLIDLLRESFILSGIFEDAQIERMRNSLKIAEERRKDWLAEDLTTKTS
jgi:hypothetical protein